MTVRNYVREHRERRANDIRCLRITIANATLTVEAFIKAGLLAEDQKNNDRALEDVIALLCRAGFLALKASAETPNAG